MKQIYSPLTGKSNTHVIKDLEVSKIVNIYKPFDVSNYFGNNSSIKMMKCLDSNYIFYWPFNLEGKEDLYTYLQKRPDYYNRDRFEFDEALKYISKNDHVLEVGCGEGYFLDRLRSREIKHKGIDLNTDAVHIGKQKGLSISSMSLKRLAKSNPRFDVIVCFQVLEHIAEIKPFLDTLIKCLKKRGKLIISVPNNDGFMYSTVAFNKYNLPPHHMGLWTTKSLHSLTKFFNLELLALLHETLQKENYQLYSIYLRQRMGKFSGLYKYIPLKILHKFIRLISKIVKGHTSMVVYTKI